MGRVQIHAAVVGLAALVLVGCGTPQATTSGTASGAARPTAGAVPAVLVSSASGLVLLHGDGSVIRPLDVGASFVVPHSVPGGGRAILENTNGAAGNPEELWLVDGSGAAPRQLPSSVAALLLSSEPAGNGGDENNELVGPVDARTALDIACAPPPPTPASVQCALRCGADRRSDPHVHGPRLG